MARDTIFDHSAVASRSLVVCTLTEEPLFWLVELVRTICDSLLRDLTRPKRRAMRRTSGRIGEAQAHIYV